jgi:hypothetical protein
MSDKVKVVGYAKRDFFGNGIEYRNFTPDLVGLQTTSNSSALLFTMGNFAITTNMDPKNDKTFITNSFSNFVSLTDLNLTVNQTKTLLFDNTNTLLNLDKTNLNNYALFGSLTEFVRVSLENIITKWPASLLLTPISQTSSGQIINGNTYEDYTYDEITEISTFKVDTNYITNKFKINYLTNGTILDTYNATNDIRNLTVNYNSYVIFLNETEYPVINFTGSTELVNDYIYFTVKGNVFSGLTSARINYHIKPSNLFKDAFFNALPDFEYYLLSRNIIPLYTAVFKFPIKSDAGDILYVSKSLTWPVSDGYNIDFDTTTYIDYVTQLLEISSNNDLYASDLMNRFLVTESISDFDTTPVHVSDYDADTTGQKMNKTLHVYGRAFDDINNFISGIALANVVTYNKQANTPDKYLKNLANVLGWGIISSVSENDLLANYIKPSKSTYSGESVGLTPVEADIELWRRIILNTPWIWKSKGARKSIEFLLRFIGVPQGLVNFNEYVYIADKPIDMIQFSQILELNGLNTDLTTYPVDSDGYPNPLPDTDEMYFQGNGLWYRETGGANSTIDILTGNNPHLGPYDGGFKYINQFKELIPNFSAVTISSETTTIFSDNVYVNNQSGTFDNSTELSTIDSVVFTSISGHNISTCFEFSATVEIDPLPSEISNNCGCNTGSVDKIMSLCIKNKDAISTTPSVCGDKLIRNYEDQTNGVFVFEYYQYNPDGTIFTSNGLPVPYITNYTSVECCTYIGGSPILHETIENDTVVNSGYFCNIIPINTNYIIDAINDIGAPVSGTTGGQALANVLANDTLNGITATLSSVTLTQTSTTNPKANINVLDGSVNIDSYSVGDYTISYQICEIANPSNCDIAIVSGSILNHNINAVDESGNVVTGATGGVSITNVLNNDTLNSMPATTGNVTLSQISSTSTGVTLNTLTGSVNVASGTTPGTYNLIYQICEIANPSNCDTAIVSVPVIGPVVCYELLGFTYKGSDDFVLQYIICGDVEYTQHTFINLPGNGGAEAYYDITSDLDFPTGLCVVENSVTKISGGSPIVFTPNYNNTTCVPSLPFGFLFSSPGRSSSGLACTQVSFPLTLYANVNILDLGVQMYLNPDLTLLFGSGNLWYQLGIDGVSYRIDNSGQIAEIVSC